ncbi:GNAT family N-acetyltransferase [Parachlamydia sp. AcF125]|uniref:GNAT family N-acetyltransferase n=1 Tax=Parachlamydia sp. AcF125 TaxID=2795736 RepID=UPI001BCA4831|nr:GNAT family N-acetyltransferase [Parachlamydia sp. AcF125]MBS4167765.1 hypothetical protein [Parachlamydia sp. AcF125]
MCFYKSNPLPTVETRAFTSALASFKKLEQLPSIQKSLKLLEETFSSQVKLKHPRDVYPLYQALNFVTNEVAKKSLYELSNSWRKVLKALNHRQIYRKGLGPTYLDTTIAQKILTQGLAKLQNSIAITSMDLKNKSQLRKVVNYLLMTDREAFGACFQKGFFQHILKSKRVRCVAACNKKNEMVGILWGFLAYYQNQQIFHFWELSRSPSMAHMGIARKLIDYAKQQQRAYPKLKFATLHVEAQNLRAKGIYARENFAANSEKERIKVFMANKLDSSSNIPLKAKVSKKIVRNFVLNTIPFYKLLYYELLRRCELIWRACWYR